MNTKSLGVRGGFRRNRTFDVAVGARIKARRERKKLSQIDLGEMIGVTGAQMSRYEGGKTSCDPATLVVIAEKLGCKVSALIDGLKADAT
jgi:transcriptional regulator with XRE-family HTH domain